MLALHADQLAHFGGAPGLRDEGLLASAVARVGNRLLDGGRAVSLSELAASLAFGIIRNHAFIDGNKRTSLAAALVFLEANGKALRSCDDDLLRTWLDLAAGDLSEQDLARWLEPRLAPLDGRGDDAGD